MIKRLFILSIISLLLAPQVVLAATFDPSNIISDNDLIDKNAMNAEQVQNFLTNKGGALASYSAADPWGETKTAAQIIYDAGQYYTISPKFLIVTLQKEQSLITDPSPTQRQYDWAAGYAVCDSCSTSDPGIQQYKGFFNQVNWSARRNRYYIETAGQWNFKVGQTYTIDDQQVTMDNQASVNLYTYTPHIHGNYNFWLLWNSWFSKNYPNGSLLQAQGEDTVYLIQNGQKRAFTSRSALVSRFDPSRIILVSKTDLDAYEDGYQIKFANYSLVKSIESGRTFLIDGDTKRYIESPEVFRKIGFNPEETIEVNNSELTPYSWGNNININSIYPTGVLLQSSETGGVSYVENGIRHSIWSKEILNNKYAHLTPVLVEQATIDEYEKGEPVKFKDSELVTSPGSRSVYFISNGQKHRVDSKEVFDTLGFKWENIIWTSDGALRIHENGSPITIEN